jgi:hypothetical protein
VASCSLRARLACTVAQVAGTVESIETPEQTKIVMIALSTKDFSIAKTSRRTTSSHPGSPKIRLKSAHLPVLSAQRLASFTQMPRSGGSSRVAYGDTGSPR